MATAPTTAPAAERVNAADSDALLEMMLGTSDRFHALAARLVAARIDVTPGAEAPPAVVAALLRVALDSDERDAIEAAATSGDVEDRVDGIVAVVADSADVDGVLHDSRGGR